MNTSWYPDLRRTKNVEELLPWLYLKGISTGQFEEALAALLGPKAGGLSPPPIRRLVEVWQDEHKRWQGRDLPARRYVYVWADGIYFSPRLEHERQCILVIIGADASGKKELLAIDDGFRESEQSWHELLVRPRDENGLQLDPELATSDRALGFMFEAQTRSRARSRPSDFAPARPRAACHATRRSPWCSSVEVKA